MSTSFKDSIGRPRLKVGIFIVEFISPGIGEICKLAGCDFAVLDLEHSGFTYETVKTVVKYMHAADLPLIVRVPSREYHDISRALDVGADGVMLPMVSTIEEARRIVQSAKYYPQGMRGVAMGLAHDRYRISPLTDAFRANNQRTILALQIENVSGVDAADEIAALDGVDMLWVGHLDLSVSLGIPGEFEHPKFTAAIERVNQACRKHGKSMARVAASVAQSVELYQAGFDVQTYGSDVAVLRIGLTRGVAEMRSACAAVKAAAE
jgi:2-dehydro-3-deoxyglucarate aldolase/4-hydroxy-2-oxoheptanedioate aldolase